MAIIHFVIAFISYHPLPMMRSKKTWIQAVFSIIMADKPRGVVLRHVIYNLFFALYLLVIAFLPLSHLHVENTVETPAIALSSCSVETARFIDFIHEVFFSHLGQTMDQAPSAPIKTCKSFVGLAKLNFVKSSPPSFAQAHALMDSMRILKTHNIRQGDSSGHVQGRHQGFAPCFSGLSPPSVSAS